MERMLEELGGIIQTLVINQFMIGIFIVILVGVTVK